MSDLKGAGHYYIEFFDPEFVELQKELMTGYHPKLAKLLGQLHTDDIDTRLAHIASYCEVILDGVYDIESRARLAGILKDKLILKRENPNSSIVIIQ